MSEYITDQFDPRFYQQPKHVRDAIRKAADAERAPRTDAPTGTPMTRDQFFAKLKAQEQVKERLEQSVRDKVPTEPVSPYARRIADLEEAKAHGSMPKQAADRRLKMYRKAEQDWQTEQEAKAAKAAYDQSPAIVLMREHALAFERTQPVGATDDEINLAVAVAKSTLFTDPDVQVKEYWKLVADCEGASEARQREQLGQSVFAVKDALTGLDQQKEALADTEARAEHAREQAGA